LIVVLAAITPNKVLKDANVCASPAAGTPNHCEGDFAWLERISFNDLLQEWCNARPESITESAYVNGALKEFLQPYIQVPELR
jgi:hypothetical protein